MHTKSLTLAVATLSFLLIGASVSNAKNCAQLSQWGFASPDHPYVVAAPLVVALGDIDDDGFQDFAYSYSPTYQDLNYGGQVSVVSGRLKQVLYTFTTPGVKNDHFGWAIAPAGDVNGDGQLDFMVSDPAPESYQGDQTKAVVYIYDALSGTLLFSIPEPGLFSLFGYSMAGLGDIDSDGYDDLVIGAPSTFVTEATGNFRHNAGRVYVLSGRLVTTGETFAASVLYQYSGVGGFDQLGAELVNLGDITGDGINDFGIGQGRIRDKELKPVQIISGGDGAILYTIPILSQSIHIYSGSSFRYDDVSIASAGDMNSDGIPDILIGNARDTTYGLQSGAAYLYSGADGTLLDTYYSTNPGPSEGFGKSVGVGGDVNGDGVLDVLIGSYYGRPGWPPTIPKIEQAAVHIFSGADKSLLYTVESNGEARGQFVAMLGDATGDCLGDVLIGADGLVELVSFPDACGSPAAASCAGCCNLPGDANGDGSASIGDVTFLIQRIFSGGPAPECCQEADSNADGSISIADVTTMISRIFLGGAAPSCGPSDMNCVSL
jgi:FG-GAP repeat/Dockerin type I domain